MVPNHLCLRPKPAGRQTAGADSFHSAFSAWHSVEECIRHIFVATFNGNQATDAFIWLIFSQCLGWKLHRKAQARAWGASPIFRGHGASALTSHPSFLYIKGEILTPSLLRQHETPTWLKCRSKQCHINLSGPKCFMRVIAAAITILQWFSVCPWWIICPPLSPETQDLDHKRQFGQSIL